MTISSGGVIALSGVTSEQGNGAKVQLSTGSTTNGDCVKFDANGNTIDAGSACGGGGGGSPGGTNTAIQYNNAGSFGGDTANFSWNDSTGTMNIGSSLSTVYNLTSGGALNIKANGQTGPYSLSITSATPTTSGDGGRLEINSGNGFTNGEGGQLTLTTGNGVYQGFGGIFEINTGNGGTDGGGGTIMLNAGYGNGLNQGGDIDLTAGSANNDGSGGNLNLYAGSANASSSNSNAVGGYVALVAGGAGSNTDGSAVYLLGAAGGYLQGNGGPINLWAGEGGGGTSNGGDVVIQPASTSGTGRNGQAQFKYNDFSSYYWFPDSAAFDGTASYNVGLKVPVITAADNEGTWVVMNDGTPTVSACGSGAAVAGNDNSGTITEGSVATGCTLTFSVTKGNAPVCVLSAESGLAFSYSQSTSAVTISNIGALSGTKIDYFCPTQ
jgi:hypothetical protein